MYYTASQDSIYFKWYFSFCLLFKIVSLFSLFLLIFLFLYKLINLGVMDIMSIMRGHSLDVKVDVPSRQTWSLHYVHLVQNILGFPGLFNDFQACKLSKSFRKLGKRFQYPLTHFRTGKTKVHIFEIDIIKCTHTE